MDEKFLEQYRDKNIDLTPDWYKKRKKQKYLKMGIVVAAILIIGISIFGYLQVADRISRLEAQNKSIMDEIVEIKKVGNEQDIINVIGDRIQYKEDLLTVLDEENESAIKLIYIMERNMPINIETLSMSINSTNSVTLSGTSDNKRAVSDFIHRLKSEEFFNKVFVGGINKQNKTDEDGEIIGEEFSFSINCTFGGGE